MFVVNYWWVFMVLGAGLWAFAVHRHLHWMSKIGDWSLGDFDPLRLRKVNDANRGFFLVAVAMFLGGLSLVIGLVGMVAAIVLS